MNPTAKIYIADHRGIVGSALICNLHAKGREENIVKPELPSFPQKRESRNPATGWAPAFAGATGGASWQLQPCIMNLIKKAQKHPGLWEARPRAESGDGCFGLGCSRPGGRSHGVFKGRIIKKPVLKRTGAVRAERVEALCAAPFDELRANGEFKGRVIKWQSNTRPTQQAHLTFEGWIAAIGHAHSILGFLGVGALLGRALHQAGRA